MTVELVRMVWCDICLKRDKTRVEAVPDEDPDGHPVVVHNGKLWALDACGPHKDKNLLLADIYEYGYPLENQSMQAALGGAQRRPKGRITNQRKTGPTEFTHRQHSEKASEALTSNGTVRIDKNLGRCSTCRQVISKSHLNLHNKRHVRLKEPLGVIIALAE